MRSLALFLMVTAQTEDAGVADAGVECAPACDVGGNAVTFCDDENVVTLDCATVEGSNGCTTISADWGDDCVLSEGAACDPGYAFGASRCDPRRGLACLDTVCAPGEPQDEAPLEPTPGTNVVTPSTSSSSDPFNCAACTGSSAAGFVAFGWLLRVTRSGGRGLRATTSTRPRG